jgi:hypothetical protein
MEKNIIALGVFCLCSQLFSAETLNLPNTSIQDAKNAVMKTMKISNVSDYHLFSSNDYSITFRRNSGNDSFWQNVATRSANGTVKTEEELMFTFTPDENATQINADIYNIFTKDIDHSQSKKHTDSFLAIQVLSWTAENLMIKQYNKVSNTKIESITAGQPCEFKDVKGLWLFRWEYGYICGDIQNRKLIKQSGL